MVRETASVSACFLAIIEVKLRTSSTTRACCSAVNCGNMGKETISAAAFSVTGKSPAVVQRRVGLLQVQWNRIVDSRPDTGLFQMVHQAFAISGTDHIQVIHSLRRRRLVGGFTPHSVADSRRLYSAARSRRCAFHFAK